MIKSPVISVIITAFNRKDFLPNALNSVLNQTLDRSKYEIIVVKNFSDQKIDSLLQDTGAISLLRGNEGIGTYTAAGIERSAGEILLFLDDDDEFVKDKLQVVQDIFSSDPSVGYYHNSIVPMDVSGKEIPMNFRKGPSRFIEKSGRFFVRKPLDGSHANKLLRAAAYGYQSAIAVRKNVMLPYLTNLRDFVESSPDIFTFYCALLSSACSTLVVDSLKLTRYRIHPSNISLFKGAPTENSTIQNEGRILKFLSREERSLESLLNISGAINQNHDDKGYKITKKMIGYELYNRKVNLDMIDPLSNRKRVLTDAFKFFKYSFRSRFFGSQVTILIRSILWVIFPNTTRRLFVKRFR
jgi:glycosyltransferase involved in cell wall biosynthesis